MKETLYSLWHGKNLFGSSLSKESLEGLKRLYTELEQDKFFISERVIERSNETILQPTRCSECEG